MEIYNLNHFLTKQTNENRIEIDNNNYIISNGDIKKINDNYIKNPFFINIYEENDKDLFSKYYKIYDSILILCLKDSVNDISNIGTYFFKELITLEQMNKISDNFMLFRYNMNILKQNNFKKIHCILQNDLLKTMFGNLDIDFEVTELVIPLIELKYSSAKLYISLYDEFNNFKNLDIILETSRLYNKNYEEPILKNTINFLTNFNVSFWSNKINCNLNMTKNFLGRNFTYNIVNQSNIEQGIVNNSTEKSKIISKLKNESNDVDYIKSILEDNKSFVDIYNALNETNRTYYAKTDTNDLKFSKNSIISYIFDKTNYEFDKFFLINNLIVSKEYCHLVLNNLELLKELNKINYFNKHKIIFKYTFGYAWLCMYIEECIFKTKSTKHSRYVFDIDTVNQLPYFPISFDDIWQNPYLTLLIDNKIIDLNNNCTSLKPINNEKYYGTCNLNEFKQRVNIFICGDSKRNIFSDLDWSKFALSGSIILACAERNSPLMDNYIVNSSNDNKLLNYYKIFFKDSDIDLMSNTNSIIEFIKNVSHFLKILKKNLNLINEQKSSIETIPVKYSGIMISDYFIDYYLEELNQELGLKLSKNELIEKIDTKSYDLNEYFYDKYFEIKKKMLKIIKNNYGDIYNDDNIDNEILRMYLKKNDINKLEITYRSNFKITKNNYIYNDLDYPVFINDIVDEKVDEESNFLVYKQTEGIRYKFKSELLLRDIELFQVKGPDYFSVVGKFHFPCVRSYYNGENVYFLPSSISSYMTKINIDYKYFAGTNDPIKIANKYRSRGFTAIFNNEELKHMLFYNNEIRENNDVYHIEGKNKDDLKKDLQVKTIKDNIFLKLFKNNKSDLNENNLINEEKNDEIDYINDLNKVKSIYKEKFNYDSDNSVIDMFKLKSINKNGNINPYKDWVLKSYWDNFE